VPALEPKIGKRPDLDKEAVQVEGMIRNKNGHAEEAEQILRDWPLEESSD
jgi:hypothetical protein